MIHLGCEDLDAIRRILKSHVPECDVWLFGSRAHGRALKPYSDIDLAVITNQPMNVSQYAYFQEAFSESELPFKVDIVDWSAASESFREVIRECHEVLQKGQKQSA
ncbi:MAG: nucleotidyltransferase family protein [Gammaproteobacteria bacterium]